MITRISIAAVAMSFITTVAFSQMRYSKSRSASPTPTPTPLPLIPAQRGTPPPRTTPPQPVATPQQRMVYPQTQLKQSPTPLPRTMPAANQQRTMSIQPRPSPTFATIPPKLVSTPAPTPAKPTPTPVPPPDIKAYLDRQVANSKDQKFHFTVNGKDLALTPFHVWPQKSTGPNTTSTSISMRSDDGRVYDIDFVTAGAQVTGIKISRINGESVR